MSSNTFSAMKRTKTVMSKYRDRMAETQSIMMRYTGPGFRKNRPGAKTPEECMPITSSAFTRMKTPHRNRSLKSEEHLQKDTFPVSSMLSQSTRTRIIFTVIS